MNESASSEGRTGKPPDQETFHFAGVELRPGESPQDKMREAAMADLWKNSVISILIGLGFAATVLFVGKLIADPYGFDPPKPFPYFSHGVLWFALFFYAGWAMYWGIRDCLNADMMDEEHGVNQFLDGVNTGIRGPMQRTTMLRGAIMLITIVGYGVFGGGIKGFYKLLRQSRKTGTEPRA